MHILMVFLRKVFRIFAGIGLGLAKPLVGTQFLGDGDGLDTSPAEKETLEWQGKSVRVRVRLLPRYLWIAGSLDVFLADQCILSTGRQPSRGSYSASFGDGGSEHRVEVVWRRPRGYRLPYKLRFDGVTADDSEVGVENWGMGYIPTALLIGLGVLFWVAVLHV
jgi:hypothetical protein